MALSFFNHIPYKKIVTFVGLCISASITKGLMTSILGLAALYFGPPSFLAGLFIYFPLKMLGLAIGAGLYVQALKHFQVWPMENVVSMFSLAPIRSTTFSLDPRIMWEDLKSALREFDRTFLTFLGEALFEHAYPEQSAAIRQTAAATNYSWFDIPALLKQKAAAAFLNIKKESLAPTAARMGVCQLVHELHYRLRHGAEMPNSSTQAYKDEMQQECVAYQSSKFMFDLHQTGPGFFESIAQAASNEYDHPPLRNRPQ
jgi:hypothetical protein